MAELPESIAPGPAQQGPAQGPDNHLKAIEEGILAQVLPAHAQMLEKVVISGKQLMYDERTRENVMQGFRDINDESDPRKLALGVAALLTIINRRASKIPVELMVPAGALLTCEVLRFLNEAEMLELSPAFTGDVIEELLAALMQKMGMGEPRPEQSMPNEIPGGVSPSVRQNPAPRGIINSAGAM